MIKNAHPPPRQIQTLSSVALIALFRAAFLTPTSKIRKCAVRGGAVGDFESVAVRRASGAASNITRWRQKCAHPSPSAGAIVATAPLNFVVT